TEAGPRELVRRNGACRRTRCAADRPLPFTGALELLDSADDQIPFDPTQAIDEQLAVEMIHLVLERSCEESGRVVLMFPSVSSQPLDDGTSGAHHRCVESRDTQTALFFQLHPIAFDELRIDEHQQSRRGAPSRNVDAEEARATTDLRCGQAAAGGRVHSVDNVIDDALNLECDRVDRCRWLVEETVAVLEDGSDHAGSGVDITAEPLRLMSCQITSSRNERSCGRRKRDGSRSALEWNRHRTCPIRRRQAPRRPSLRRPLPPPGRRTRRYARWSPGFRPSSSDQPSVGASSASLWVSCSPTP